MAYELLRADGLGSWEYWIRTASSQPLAGFLPHHYSELLTWASKSRTKPEDDWFRDASHSIFEIFKLLDLDSPIPDRKPTAKDLITAFVQIRNKTKAHGAVGPDFFSKATPHYLTAIIKFVTNCPAFHFNWVYLTLRDNGKQRGLKLASITPKHFRDSEIATLPVHGEGLFIFPAHPSKPIKCDDLIFTNRECNHFLVANGGASETEATFIDYGHGNTKRCLINKFTRIPTPLPSSETEGLPYIDVQSNLFGNLPELRTDYVQRKCLENELEVRLRDKNHPIITLHGRGGIGKTCLAVKVANVLAEEKEPIFEYIVWFSARDIDLRPSGPSGVKPSVTSLEAISQTFGKLFQNKISIDQFSEILQNPQSISNKGILFILDNFETMDSPKELHEFLDNYTHIPNKILITSRERAFKADFPIEVHGMEKPEANELMTNVAENLKIGGLIQEAEMDHIFQWSEGHPYVIRVVLGEIQKEGKYVPPKALLPSRIDIVNAVFERSFNKLSDDARRVFLTIASWKSLVSELALLVVLGQRGIDVERGITECLRMSMIETRLFLDEQPAYTAPQVARIFAKKKLEGDPDRLIINEDLNILHQFGILPLAQPIQIPQDSVVQKFSDWVLDPSSIKNIEDVKRVDSIVELLAALWPKAWLLLAKFRMNTKTDAQDIEFALRRATEELPFDKDSHLLRANFCKSRGDEGTYISCRLRAVEADPADKPLLREVASEICKYINDHAQEIPVARRSVYLASLREKMVAIKWDNDATAMSRLAWLYLLEDNKAQAWKYASRGLAINGDNNHCMNIIERLRKSGFQPD